MTTEGGDIAGGPRSRWETAARWLWLLLAVGIAVRFVFGPNPAHNNVYLKVFAPAAQAFVDGRPLYDSAGGFRYPPLCAALFWPFAQCGAVLGSILWRGFNLLLLWLGVRAVLRRGFPFAMDSKERGVFLLLLLAAEAVSLNNGQPNVLILGLLLLATVGALDGREAGPALAVTASTVCKVYPLAYGMVLATLRPRLWWRMLTLVLLAAALPFLLQSPDYVLEQYRQLAWTLGHDDRTGDLANAYRDLRLLAAAAGWQMPAAVFLALQVGCGGGIALLCWLLRRAGAPPSRVAELAFSLTMCWFMLLGPATEKSTYALLGPTLAWPLLRAWRQRWPAGLWLWGAANALMLLSHAVEPVDRRLQAEQPWLRCFLPAAALLAAAMLLTGAVGELRARRLRSAPS